MTNENIWSNGGEIFIHCQQDLAEQCFSLLTKQKVVKSKWSSNSCHLVSHKLKMPNNTCLNFSLTFQSCSGLWWISMYHKIYYCTRNMAVDIWISEIKLKASAVNFFNAWRCALVIFSWYLIPSCIRFYFATLNFKCQKNPHILIYLT